jgi:succinyl-diaminopimelate desuccinylase
VKRSRCELPENAIVAFASDLIAIASENPPGAAYDDCLARVGAELEALAIDYELVETGEDQLRRQAILAAVGETGPLLYLHGHMT